MKKYIFLITGFIVSGWVSGQNKPAHDWHHQGVSKKNIGVDDYRAYQELLKNKTASPIVVAVIDGGTDINHEDLKDNIWHNPGEIPFNGVDDDKNGYVDDTVGWNFIGGKDGGMVEYDNLEMTRLLREYEIEFEDVDAEDIGGSAVQKARYEEYQNIKREVKSNKMIYSSYLEQIEKAFDVFDRMRIASGKDDPSAEDLEKFSPEGEKEKTIKDAVIKQVKNGMSFKSLYNQINEQYKQVEAFAKYHYNTEYDPRPIVGDDYNNSAEKYYGNNNVKGPDASHGTHVAGIIAAVRNNGIGMDGISNAKIMVLRVVPNGDERDKDVANSIIYATDNGAKIINMSFGKSYKWDKEVVNNAVAYAVSKGVLLIHAAGNDGKNTDIENNFPNDNLGDNKYAETWIEVGASAPPKKTLATDFSNYGQTNIDLFAPGYQIYSTTPENTYDAYNGTSMAAPVTAGVAALVWSHYPSLTAKQMKEILMKSVVVNRKKVPVPGEEKKKAKFTTLSVTGGVVNAYNALKIAEEYTK